jgi:hypothetical protein
MHLLLTKKLLEIIDIKLAWQSDAFYKSDKAHVQFGVRPEAVHFTSVYYEC